MANNYTRETCRFCNSSQVEKVLQLGPTPLGDDYVQPEDRLRLQPLYPVDAWLCRDCGLVQLLDIVHPENIYNEYIYLTRTSQGLARHFKAYADDLDRFNLPVGSLAVDIGSNDGTLLQALKAKGYRVTGVEPAARIAALATEEGVPTIPAFFGPEVAERILKEQGPAHCISTNNILANVDDLTDMIAGIRNLLADDGIYAVECSYLGDLIDNCVFDYIYHEHLSYFSIVPMQKFFAANGMELFCVTRTDSKGGSVRVFVQKVGGPRQVSQNLIDLVEWENKRGLHDPQTYADFRRRIASAGDACRELLRKFKDDGKSVACFGASPTTATLVYHFGLQDLFDYYVDENTIKIGRYSPGNHLPVLGPDSLLERKPDFVFLAAWRYWKPIIAKNQAYIDQGGTFIIPLPDIRFVSGFGRTCCA